MTEKRRTGKSMRQVRRKCLVCNESREYFRVTTQDWRCPICDEVRANIVKKQIDDL